MPTPTKGPRLGGSPSHERLMLANLATALFEHDRITTTEAKAKRLRPLAERLITFAKRGDLHARRQVMTVVRDKDVVHKLFAEIGPRFAERAGGYTRIVKVGPRKGDNAPMAVIELVEALTAAAATVREGERARGTKVAPRKAPSGRTAEIAEQARGESATAARVAGAASVPVTTSTEEVLDQPEIEAELTETEPNETEPNETAATSESAEGGEDEGGLAAIGVSPTQVDEAAATTGEPEAGGELAAAPEDDTRS